MSRTTTRSTHSELSVDDELDSLEKLLVAQTVYEFGRGAWPTIAQLLTEHPSLVRPKGSFTPRSCQAIHSRLIEEAGLECSEADNIARRGPSNLKLAQRLYAVRLRELKDRIAAEEVKFRNVEAEILAIRSGAWDDKIKAKLGLVAESPAAEAAPAEPEPAKEDVIHLVHPSEPHEEGIREPSVEELPPLPRSPVPQNEDEEHTDHVQPVVESEKSIEQDTHISEAPSPEDDAAVESVIDAPHYSPSPPPQTPAPTSPSPDIEPQKAETPAVTALEGEDEDEDMQIASDEEKDDEGAQPETMVHETAREDVSMDDEVPEVHTPESAKETSEKASPIPSPEDEAVSPEVETPRAEEVASPDKTLSQTPTPRNTAPSPDAEEKVMTPAAETDEAESPRKSPSPVMETAQPSNEPSVEPEESRSNGKRKASEVEVAPSESARDKKRARDGSQPDGEEEAGPSTSPSKRRPQRLGTEATQSSKRFQSVIGMIHSQISQHRNGNIFHNPIKPSEAPDYQDIVLRPMDLKTIKTRIKEGAITNSLEFQRDVYLMFANSMMYNRPDSDIYTMAEEMMLESEIQINEFRQTEGIIRSGHHRL